MSILDFMKWKTKKVENTEIDWININTFNPTSTEGYTLTFGSDNGLYSSDVISIPDDFDDNTIVYSSTEQQLREHRERIDELEEKINTLIEKNSLLLK